MHLSAFQFLIGRLETCSAYGYLRFAAAFQFLIGRLETERRLHSDAGEAAFQFLIGRLETHSHLIHAPKVKYVSIPHR